MTLLPFRTLAVVCLALACTLVSAQTPTPGTITTIAGAQWAFPADGGPATTAPLGVTSAVAFDAQGNLYIGDTGNNVVLKVSSSGTLRIFAGMVYTYGYDGDNGPATMARLGEIAALTVDSGGNVYIADRANAVVRRVSMQGVITTFAGDGYSNYSGDGSPATMAELCSPVGLAADALGNIYIADDACNVVRKVTPNGIISRFAGTTVPGYSGDHGPATAAQLYAPRGLAADANNNLYIADVWNYAIRFVNTSGTITTVAGNGYPGFSGDNVPATAAALDGAGGVAVDALGSFYIADTYNSRIRKVTAGTITTIAGNGDFGFYGDGSPATVASLNNPAGVAIGPGNIVYIADGYNYRVRMVGANGAISTFAGNGRCGDIGDNNLATAATLAGPQAVRADAAGNLYIADTYHDSVRKIDTAGVITTIAGTGYGYGGVPRRRPPSVKLAASEHGPATGSILYYPQDVLVDPAGNIYIADSGNNVVQKIDTSGIMTIVAGYGYWGDSGDGGPATEAMLASPNSLAMDTDGNLYIGTDYTVRKVDTAGMITTFAGSGPIGAPRAFFAPRIRARTETMPLGSPQGLAFDAAGNLYVADYGNSVVLKFAPNGSSVIFAGTGTYGYSGDGGPATAAELSGPAKLAFSREGNLYIADAGNCVIRKVSPNGTITRVAGNGTCDYTGDGGPATAAALNFAAGIGLDAGGNLYIADTDNNRIRKLIGAEFDFGITLTPPTLAATAGGTTTATAAVTGVGGFSSPVTLSCPGPSSISCMFSPNPVTPGSTSSMTVTVSLQAQLGSTTLSLAGDGGGVHHVLTVPLTIQLPPNTMALISGNNQWGATGSPLPNPLVVRVQNPVLGPVSGITVAFTVSGGGSVAPVSMVTGYDGLAQTVLTLGTNPGSYTVTATAGTAFVNFTALALTSHGTAAIAAGQAAPGGFAHVPVVLALDAGIGLDGFSFGLRVTPNNLAPASPAPLTFSPAAGIPAPAVSDSDPTQEDIAVSWLDLTSPFTGTVALGEVLIPVPATATDGQTYTVQIIGVAGSDAVQNIGITAGPTATFTVRTMSYLVGDVFPFTAAQSTSIHDLDNDGDNDDAGEFGDEGLTNLDLIATLRAITNVTGYLPASCLDRFDVMDTYPKDTLSARGGDEVLNTMDLIVTLRRVVKLDTMLPRRTTRGTVCQVPVPGKTVHLSEPRPPRPEPAGTAEATLVFGTPEPGAQPTALLVPVRLTAKTATTLAGLAFSLAARPASSPRFIPADGLAPSVIDNDLPGVLSVAWLEGFDVPAPQSILLGYVEIDASLASLSVTGATSNYGEDGAAVKLAYPQVINLRLRQQ